MEVILHIGMGKTGTSSIQTALSANAARLRSQGVEYLGMWFDMLDPRFSGLSGQQAFFDAGPEGMAAHARHFIDILTARQNSAGTNRFILSNEEFYGQVQQFAPFVAELSRHARVRLVAYVRNPHEWLPSAYSQWSVFHKNYTGPVRPYAEMARQLVRVYSGFTLWGNAFPELLTVRPFLKSHNVVEDFAALLGLHLDLPQERRQTRVDLDESVLRILYNNRLPENTLPSVFDDAFRGFDLSETLSLSDILDRMLDYRETDLIIGEVRHLFDYLNTRFGIEFAPDPAAAEPPIDREALNGRLFEHMLHLAMHQADRIRALERAVSALQQERHERP